MTWMLAYQSHTAFCISNKFWNFPGDQEAGIAGSQAEVALEYREAAKRQMLFQVRPVGGSDPSRCIFQKL